MDKRKINKRLKKVKERNKQINDSRILKLSYSVLLKHINKALKDYRKRRPNQHNYHSLIKYFTRDKKVQHMVIGYIKNKENFEKIVDYVYSSEFVQTHYNKKSVKEYVDFQIKEYVQNNIKSKKELPRNILKKFEELHNWQLLFPLSNIELGVRYFKLGPHKIIKFTKYYEKKWKRLIHKYFSNSKYPHQEDFYLKWFKRDVKNVLENSICALISIRTGDSKTALEKAKKELELFMSCIKYMSWLWYKEYNDYKILYLGQNYLRWSVSIGFSESGGSAGSYENKNPLPFQFTRNNIKRMLSYGTYKIGKILNISEEKRTDFQKIILEALNMYGDAASDNNNSSAYVKFTTILEFLLVKRDERISVNLSERVAFLLHRLVDFRKAIFKNVKGLYRIRGDIVHAGKRDVSSDDLKNIRRIVFNILLLIINCHDQFKNKNEFIEKINEIKFGKKVILQKKQLIIGNCW